MNKEQIVAIIQRGYFTDGDLADALLAELAKVSEPVAYAFEDGSLVAERNMEFVADKTGQRVVPLFTHPQPDLVAEIERTPALMELGKRLAARLDEDDWSYIEPFLLAVESSSHRQINELRQQLSNMTESRNQWLCDQMAQVIRTNEELSIAKDLQKQLSAAQADLEILKSQVVADETIQRKLEMHLQVEQADNEELVAVLEEIKLRSISLADAQVVALEAIAAHKARKEKV